MPRNAKTMLGWASQQPSSPEPPPRAAQRAALPHQPPSPQAGPSLLIRPRSCSRSPAPVKIYPRQTLLEAYPQQGPAQEMHPQQAYPQRGFSQQAYPQQAYPRQALPQQGRPQPAYSRQPPCASRVPQAPPLYRQSPLDGMSAGEPPAARRSYLQLMAICDRSPVPVPRAPQARAGTAGDDLDGDLDEDLAAIRTGEGARWTGPIYLLGALVLFAGLECLLMASGALPPIAATIVSLAASAVLLRWPAIRARWQAPAPSPVVEAVDQHDTEEMPFPPGAFDPDPDEASEADPEDSADAGLSASHKPDSGADENAGPGSRISSAHDGIGATVDVAPEAKPDPGADSDAGISVDIRADDAALDPEADAGTGAAARPGASTGASTGASAKADAGANSSAPAGASTRRAVAARARG